MTRYFLCFLSLFITSIKGFSQLTETEKELIAPSRSVSPSIDHLLELNFRGVSSTGTTLPFWLHHNQRGRITESSKFSTWLTAKSVLFFSEDAFFLTGTSILYRDGRNEGLVPDELFVHFQNSWVYFTGGRKQRPDLFLGLSATNENILWSLNVRPLPGLQLGTSNPVLLFGTWGPGFEFSWNEYFLGKERRIQNAKLHHKSLHLIYSSKLGMKLKVGAQHFAHWGGQRSEGTLPEGSGDYWKAITLKDNLHTHMTTYEAYLENDFGNFTIQFLYNHFATDRSGRLYENAPDGRYGLFLKHENQDNIINAINYEFFYTKNQSKDSASEFVDNYFNFYEYSEGWAYKHHFMGLPFFTYHPDSRRITENIFVAHHIGIGGQINIPFETNPYRLLLSYVRSSGTYANPVKPSEDRLMTFFEMGLIKEPVNVDLQISSDATANSSPAFGLGLHVNYRF